MVFLCIVFLNERESEEELGAIKTGFVSTFTFLHASNAEKPNLSSPISKGFINYVFLRNRAVRNLAGTRLDSLAW